MAAIWGGSRSEPPSRWTVSDKIFAITCTTCRARIAVHSESAVGAILECPKCQSLVQIVPPEGWKPAVVAPVAPPVVEAAHGAPSGPPPLSKVATDAQLELEPAAPFSLSVLLGQTWAMWTIGMTITVALAAALWVLLMPATSAHTHESTATVASTPPAANANPAPVKSADEAKAETTKPDEAKPEAIAKTPDTPDPQTVSKPAELAENKPAQPALPPIAPKETPKPPAQPPAVASEKANGIDPFAEAPAQLTDGEGPSPAEIKRAPPAMIDPTARLNAPLATVELTNVPLTKLIDTFAALTAVPMTIDADALSRHGISPITTISVRSQGTTIGGALEAAVSQLGLTATSDGGQTIITVPSDDRETLRQVRYTVSDLSGEGKEAVAAMIPLVRGLVSPESWQGVGGRGTIEATDTALVVSQTGEVHQQILVFCEKLRNARHKPLRSRDNPERFALTTRLEQAGKILGKPISINFHEPTVLSKVVAAISQRSGATILIDHAALAAAETSDQVEATVTVQNEPLSQTLKKLLRPLGLAYRVVGTDVIQITSKEAADERLELEFYPIKTWLDAGFTGRELAERLKARVAGRTWSDVGGAGEVYFDEPSGCLIVLQSQPTQDAVRRLLALPPPKKG